MDMKTVEKKKDKYFFQVLALIILMNIIFPLENVFGNHLVIIQHSFAAEAPDGSPYYPLLPDVKIINTQSVKSAVLLDCDSGRVLYGFNEHAKLNPASITKLMMAYIVLEKIHEGSVRWSDPVTASLRACRVEPVKLYLKKGETMPLKEMFKAIIISSANDAAVAVAEKIAGSEEAFVALMNEKAQQLGLKETHFINCNGLPTCDSAKDENHYMSAHDIALLSRELVKKFPEIIEFSKIKSTSLGNRSRCNNTNELLGVYPGLDGLKTGYTSRAGYCLSATAARNGLRLISVVLGASTPAARRAATVKLLNYGFDNFQRKIVFRKNELVTRAPVVNGLEKEVGLVAADDVAFLVKKDYPINCQVKIQLKEPIEAPVAAGSVLGQVYCQVNGSYTGQPVNLLADRDIGGMVPVYIDGTELKFPLMFTGGAALVSLEKIAKVLGAEIKMDSQLKTVLVRKNDLKIILRTGSNVAFKNNNSSILPWPVKLVDGEIMVPLRFLCEALGAKVKWNESKKEIYVFTGEGG